jgi:hypothetical protein
MLRIQCNPYAGPEELRFDDVNFRPAKRKPGSRAGDGGVGQPDGLGHPPRAGEDDNGLAVSAWTWWSVAPSPQPGPFDACSWR